MTPPYSDKDLLSSLIADIIEERTGKLMSAYGVPPDNVANWEHGRSPLDDLLAMVERMKSPVLGLPARNQSFAYSMPEHGWHSPEVHSQFGGIPVVVCAFLQPRRIWVYPKERFWEYTPSPETERWCRYFGYGHEQLVYDSYLVNGTLYVHPVVNEQLKHGIPRA